MVAIVGGSYRLAVFGRQFGVCQRRVCRRLLFSELDMDWFGTPQSTPQTTAIVKTMTSPTAAAPHTKVAALRQHALVKKLGDKALHPHIWRAHRRSMPKAVFIGLWLACCPLPIQMVLAIWSCVRSHAHLPTALALVWLNNPLTIAPLFYLSYQVGLLVLQQPSQPLEFTASWAWFENQLHGAVPALLIGSVVLGTVVGAVGYLMTRWWYRRDVQQRLHKRRSRRGTTR